MFGQIKICRKCNDCMAYCALLINLFIVSSMLLHRMILSLSMECEFVAFAVQCSAVQCNVMQPNLKILLSFFSSKFKHKMMLKAK